MFCVLVRCANVALALITGTESSSGTVLDRFTLSNIFNVKNKYIKTVNNFKTFPEMYNILFIHQKVAYAVRLPAAHWKTNNSFNNSILSQL